MSWSLVGVCVWIIVTSVVGMFPSRDYHWRAAYRLIAVGIPLLGWVTYENGPVWGLLSLAAGASILRWPVVYLWRWARRNTVG
ncbi:MAG: DUF2484 family protein [Paracoccaceae bacterium]|jgi:hypothetical protein